MPRNKVSSADNQQERLYAEWITGFVDGEGCFSISCNRNSTTKFGYQIFPEFVVTQGQKSLMALKKIKIFFGCGNIFINRRYDNHHEPLYRYCVRSLDDLIKIIIPFFEEHQLQTAKRKDFNLFARGVRLMQKRKHLHKTGIQKIMTLKSRMNRKKIIRLENPQRLHAESH